MEKTSITPYIVGFVLALALTLFAYGIVVTHLLTGSTLVAAIIGLALVQLLVQLVCFLHLGRKTNDVWHDTAFYFMMLILVIIVGGSLWIMQNMNYHMQMTPGQMNQYMLNENKKGF